MVISILIGVFLIRLPKLRIRSDVFTDSVKRFGVADDMFEIISLPQLGTRGLAQFIDSFGGNRLKCPN